MFGNQPLYTGRGVDCMKNNAILSIRILLLSAVAALGASAVQGEQGTAAKQTASELAPASSALASAADDDSLQPDFLQPPCSVCSDFACQTRSLGAQCALSSGPPGNRMGSCEQLSDRTCSTDGQITCKCVRAVP